MSYEKYSLIFQCSQRNHTSLLHKHKHKADETLSWVTRNKALPAELLYLTNVMFSIPAIQ